MSAEAEAGAWEEEEAVFRWEDGRLGDDGMPLCDDVVAFARRLYDALPARDLPTLLHGVVAGLQRLRPAYPLSAVVLEPDAIVLHWRSASAAQAAGDDDAVPLPANLPGPRSLPTLVFLERLGRAVIRHDHHFAAADGPPPADGRGAPPDAGAWCRRATGPSAATPLLRWLDGARHRTPGWFWLLPVLALALRVRGSVVRRRAAGPSDRALRGVWSEPRREWGGGPVLHRWPWAEYAPLVAHLRGDLCELLRPHDEPPGNDGELVVCVVGGAVPLALAAHHRQTHGALRRCVTALCEVGGSHGASLLLRWLQTTQTPPSGLVLDARDDDDGAGLRYEELGFVRVPRTPGGWHWLARRHRRRGATPDPGGWRESKG